AAEGIARDEPRLRSQVGGSQRRDDAGGPGADDEDVDHSVPTFYVSRSASQRMARRPGMKAYSPPRVTTNRRSPWMRRRTGRGGMVKSPSPSPDPTTGSLASPPPMKSPSLSHSDWTNSNCRPGCAPTK